MGIFSDVFDLRPEIEKQLEKQYLPMLQDMMGISSSQARKQFQELLQQAKEESVEENTASLPENFGDILLQKEFTDANIKTMLERKRAEGVNNGDIKWWWNLHDFERRIMLEVDDIFRAATFCKLKEEQGLNDEEAAKKLRKIFPVFGNSDDITRGAGADRPLPYELKDRINLYINKRSQYDLEELKNEIEEALSVNALIRMNIQKGIL
jgi:hypothetical protein